MDCVVTQKPASKCSTTVQFQTLANQLLGNPDIFIYWPVPDWLPEEDYDWLPKSERIQYIKVKQSRDRMREYNRVPPHLEEMLSFTGTHWDWDICITMRTPMVPIMKTISLSPRSRNRRDWSKQIFLIEEMVLLSEKPTIAMSHEAIQDRLTIEGYLAADRSYMLSYHEKAWIMKVAKDHFSPARLKDLRNRITEVCQMSLNQFALKEQKFKYDGKRKLNVAFVGRLERTNARLELVNELLSNQFILHSEKVNSMIYTVSPEGSIGMNAIDKDAVQVHHPKREEFHRRSKEELDLAVFFHVDTGLNMSMLEPLSFGVPEIVLKDAWSVGMLGEQYPFFVKNRLEGFALVNQFRENYEAMYARFEAWYNEWFIPTYNRRCHEENLYEMLHYDVGAEFCIDRSAELNSLRRNRVVNLLMKYGGDDFVLQDVIGTGCGGELENLQGKIGESFDERNLVFSTSWNEFRIALKSLFGYRDGSVVVGHLVKDKA